MPHAVIIGAGVIGMCAARELRQRDWEVTILDAGQPGGGASHGNAGWIVPSLSDPIPSPGLIKTSLRWMLKSDSPLYIQPRFDFELFRWLVGFWRSCNARAFEAGLAATAELNRRTFPLYDALARDGISGEGQQKGLLNAYRSPEAMEKDLQHARRLEAFGQPAPIPLSGAELREREPAIGSAVTGGFLLPAERHVRPDRLCADLAAFLTSHGVEIHAGTLVTGIVHHDNTVTAVQTAATQLPADAVLIAAGAWTPLITKLVDVRLPIQAGKGYSLDFTPPPRPVGYPLYFHETRVAVTPFAGTVRLAGTMELSGRNLHIRPNRVAAIARNAVQSLADWPADVAPTTTWTGMRPLTPDGLPVIGRLPGFRNLLVASGHAMLGVTLAPATAEAITDLITTGQRPSVLAPFDPARFVRR